MAFQRVAIAMLICSVVVPEVCYGPTIEVSAEPPRQPITPTLARQNFDASKSNPSQLNADDVDIPYESIQFDRENISELTRDGATTLELPGYSPITLTMERVNHHAGITSMTLRHEGLVSTLTHRGERFHLSLATPYGSYRVEGRADDTRFIDNRVLNQRMIATDLDYRYGHSPERNTVVSYASE